VLRRHSTRLPAFAPVHAFFALLLAFLVLAAASAPAAADENPLYAGIVVDLVSGEVLYADSADERRYPASLTKMMTLYVVFEELEAGRIDLGTRFTVSQNAANEPPSKLGVRPGSTITVEQAILSLVTVSANDVATVIAENIGGSVEAFAQRMTTEARAIGMASTQFRNANGLPNSGNYSTAADLARLGVALRYRFPQYFGYFSTESFTFNGVARGNHNNLVGTVDGVDGIKTGYINASGYNLVTSLRRNGRNVIAVVLGGRSAASRDAHMRDLLDRYVPAAAQGEGYSTALLASINYGRTTPQLPTFSVAAQIPDDHPNPRPRPSQPGEIMLAAAEPAPAVPMAPIAPEPEPEPLAIPTLPQFPNLTALAATAPTNAALTAVQILSAPVEIDARVQVASAAPIAPPAPEGVHEIGSGTDETNHPPASGWYIQIGAVGTEEAANDLLARAQRDVGAALAGAEPVTEVFEQGDNVYIRARFAGFPDEAAATEACAALQANRFACYTIHL